MYVCELQVICVLIFVTCVCVCVCVSTICIFVWWEEGNRHLVLETERNGFHGDCWKRSLRGCDCRLTTIWTLANSLLTLFPILAVYVLFTFLIVGAVFKDTTLKEQGIVETIKTIQLVSWRPKRLDGMVLFWVCWPGNQESC